MQIKKEIVVNHRYGGFSLSEEALTHLGLTREQACERYPTFGSGGRDCPELIALIKELGSSRVSGGSSSLTIVEVVIDIEVDSHDGYESVKVRSYEGDGNSYDPDEDD